MRITYLHQYFNTPEMSGGTRSFEMARRLVAKGHQVNMITSWRVNDGRHDWFETDEEGIQVHWLPVPYSNYMGYPKRVTAFIKFALLSAFKAAELSTDVVFATSTPLTIALPGAFAAIRKKVPMVFEVRDLWPELPVAVGALKNPYLIYAANYLERFAYMRSEKIVALSPGIRKGIVKAGYPFENIQVIPNSADLEFFNPLNADKTSFRDAHPELGEAPLIIYAGTLGKINGVDFLARIASAAQQLGFNMQFATVGDGSEMIKVRKVARELGILGRSFHMFPAVPKFKVPEVFSAADVAVSLVIDIEELWANSANKFFDSLASGTPVGINYGGWQADLLKKTGAGIVLPPNDPFEAAIRLNKLVSDPILLDNAGKNARRLAERSFGRDMLAGQLEKVLLSAISTHSLAERASIVYGPQGRCDTRYQ